VDAATVSWRTRRALRRWIDGDIEVPADESWIMANFELPQKIEATAFDPRLHLRGLWVSKSETKGPRSF
jgi:hypothetical protein